MINSNNLKGIRAQLGLSQKEMGEILNISEVAYRQKENNKSPFSLNEAKIISDLSNKTIEEIFFENKVYTRETTPANSISK